VDILAVSRLGGSSAAGKPGEAEGSTFCQAKAALDRHLAKFAGTEFEHEHGVDLNMPGLAAQESGFERRQLAGSQLANQRSAKCRGFGVAALCVFGFCKRDMKAPVVEFGKDFYASTCPKGKRRTPFERGVQPISSPPASASVTRVRAWGSKRGAGPKDC